MTNQRVAALRLVGEVIRNTKPPSREIVRFFVFVDHRPKLAVNKVGLRTQPAVNTDREGKGHPTDDFQYRNAKDGARATRGIEITERGAGGNLSRIVCL